VFEDQTNYRVGPFSSVLKHPFVNYPHLSIWGWLAARVSLFFGTADGGEIYGISYEKSHKPWFGSSNKLSNPSELSLNHW